MLSLRTLHRNLNLQIASRTYSRVPVVFSRAHLPRIIRFYGNKQKPAKPSDDDDEFLFGFEVASQKKKQSRFTLIEQRDKPITFSFKLRNEEKLKIVPQVEEEEMEVNFRPQSADYSYLQKHNKLMNGFEHELEDPKLKEKEIVLQASMNPKSLSSLLGVRTLDVLKLMLKLGETPQSPTQTLPMDLVELICAEKGFTVKRNGISHMLEELAARAKMATQQQNNKNAKVRCPVVVVMGHINHGKTTLLDAFRHTNIVAQEEGGITQSIAAFQTVMPQGLRVTFLDTPGHEAFSSMRARGVRLTDIAVLVVAADEGVKEQTIEAIEHIKEVGNSIIVAVNKCDKHTADIQRVKLQLNQHDIVCEDFGGDVPFVQISAKTSTNLTELAEVIEIEAGMLDLKAELDAPAVAGVIECKKAQGIGLIASVIVRNGTLRVGDSFVAGTGWGKVRTLRKFNGEEIHQVLPGEPAEVIGFREPVMPGEELVVVENEQKARSISELRQANPTAQATSEQPQPQQATEGNPKQIGVIVKGDTGGSVDAVMSSVQELPEEEDVTISVIQQGVGDISESDLEFAQTAKCAILGFNISCTPKLLEQAKQLGIQVFMAPVIYTLVDQFVGHLTTLLQPNKEISIYGTATVQQLFTISKKRSSISVAGCLVTQGTFIRAGVRILRDNKLIHEGKVRELKHFKDNVSKARMGTECGISIADWDDIQVGDIIQSVEIRSVPRKFGQLKETKIIHSRVNVTKD